MSFYRTPGDTGFDPTEHQGLGHPDEWREGSTCEDDIKAHDAERRRVWRQPPLVGIVPGGSKDTIEHRMHMDFDNDMNSYRDARAEGLQPKHVSQKAVAAAQHEVKSHEEALRVASSVGIEFPENIPVASGVDKEKYFKELI